MTQRYLRSVNIAHDFSESGMELQGYVATPLVLQTLARIVRGVNDAAQGRAYSIIGPYGTGKSAFGVFLAHWLSTDASQRRELIEHYAPKITSDLDFGVGSLFPVLMSSRASTLRQAILGSLQVHLARLKTKKKNQRLLDQIGLASENSEIAPEIVAELILEGLAFVKSQSNYKGIVLIIDELGQHLSQIHRSGDTRDLFVLQTIAEAASRTGENALLVVTILHQTFERYSTTASVAQQTEWAKVQGRYIDLVFQEPFAQMMRFAANVLATYAKPSEWAQRAKAYAVESSALGLKPNEIDDALWYSLIYDSYPLHPTVLVALPYLFRSIAQNERSLFAFLTANEQGGLREHDFSGNEISFYRLHDLYNYVEKTLGPGLFGRAKGRPWVEVSELLRRCRELPHLDLQLLSTVGTLSAIHEDRLLKPGRDLISFSVVDQSISHQIQSSLQSLIDKQLLIYSSYRDRLRLAEASDINIDDKLQSCRNDLSANQDLVALLQEYVSFRPLIAHEHSYKSGTLRSFVTRFIEHNHALTTSETVLPVGDGEIWYVVIPDDEIRARVITSPRRDVVLVLPERTTQLREALLDVAAHRMLTIDTEINHDKVAKRELSLRLIEAEDVLTELIRNSYGNAHGTWLISGIAVDVRDARKLDQALSEYLDVRFQSAPLIRNELIVRHKLSSTISRARRLLIEKLLDQNSVRLFDGDAFPPERAIYESIFIASGIHVPDEAGVWHLRLPDPKNDQLRLCPVFEAIELFFGSAEQHRRPLRELYAILASPPFGIRDSVIPILFVTSYIINSGEVALYEHDSFVAVPDIAVFERLLAKPSYFSIRRTPSSRLRAALFERVAKAFAPMALQKTGTVAVLDAVKPMLKFAQQLPAYVKSTANLQAPTRAVLDVLLTAKAPDELLYRMLPQALGLPPVAMAEELSVTYVDEFAAKLRTALEEMQNAYTILYNQCINDFAAAIVSQTRDPVLLHSEIVERMQLVLDESADTQLRALALRVGSSDSKKWMEPVAALLGKKPLSAWTDADIGVYKLAVVDIGRRLRLFEQVATASKSQYLGNARRRIGITDNSGERSIVVQLPTGSKISDLRTQIELLLTGAGIDNADKLGLLTMLLDDALPHESEG